MSFIEYYMNDALLEGVIEDTKKRFADNYSSDDIDNIVDKALPDNNKKYLPWVMKHISKGNIKQEDFQKVKSLLTAYDTHNLQRQKQLSQVDGLRDLHELATPYADYSKNHTENVKTEYEDDAIKIQSHKGHSAVIKAASLPKGSPMYNKPKQPGKAAWCVSAEDDSGNEYLNDYTNNQRLKFYTIEGKKDKRKYAIIPDKSSSPEFRDEVDDTVHPEGFIQKYPSVLNSNLKKHFENDMLGDQEDLLDAHSHVHSLKKQFNDLSTNDIQSLYDSADDKGVMKEHLDGFFIHHPNTPHNVLSKIDPKELIGNASEHSNALYNHPNFSVDHYIEHTKIADMHKSFLSHAKLSNAQVNKIYDKMHLERSLSDSHWVGSHILYNKNTEELSANTLSRIHRGLTPVANALTHFLNHKNTPHEILSDVVNTHAMNTSSFDSEVFAHNPELRKQVADTYADHDVGLLTDILMNNKKLHPELLHDVIANTDIPLERITGSKILPKTYKAYIDKQPEGPFKIQTATSLFRNLLRSATDKNTQEERNQIFDITSKHVPHGIINPLANGLSSRVPTKIAEHLSNNLTDNVFQNMMNNRYGGVGSPEVTKVLADHINDTNRNALFYNAVNNSNCPPEILSKFLGSHTNDINAFIYQGALSSNNRTPEAFFHKILEHGNITHPDKVYSRDYLSSDFMKKAIDSHVFNNQSNALTYALNSPSASPEVHLHFLKNHSGASIFKKGLGVLSKIKNLHPSVTQALVTHPETSMHPAVVKNLLKNKNLDEVNLTRLTKNAKNTFKDREAYDLLIKHPNLTSEALDNIIGTSKTVDNFVSDEDRNHALRILHEKLGQMNLPFKGMKK